MAGSPKKRARREARERAEAAAGALPRTEAPKPPANTAGALTATELDRDPRDASPAQNAPAVVIPEVLPPVPADVTSTALKRAMRARAQQYADRAIEILARAMESPDERVAIAAAKDILDRAHGKPTTDIEIGEGAGGLQIAIIKFGDGNG